MEMIQVQRRAAVLGAVAVALATGGCGAIRNNPSDQRTATPLPETSSTSQPIAEENLVHLWPLTVDQGTIECRGDQEAVFIAPDGMTYALNTQASDAGYADIGAIRRDNVSLGALRSHALALCQNS
jgi:hypothetical protein